MIKVKNALPFRFTKRGYLACVLKDNISSLVAKASQLCGIGVDSRVVAHGTARGTGRRIPRFHIGNCILFQDRRLLHRFHLKMSKDAQQTVILLKAAKGNPSTLDSIMNNRLLRLLKVDSVSVLYALVKEDEADLAIKVFDVIQKEPWYRPDKVLYRLMARAFARNGKFEEMQKILTEMQEQGLMLDKVTFMELIERCIDCREFTQAMQIFEKLKEGKNPPSAQVYQAVITSLNAIGEFELSLKLEEEIEDRVIRKERAAYSRTKNGSQRDIHTAEPWAS